MNRIVKLFSFNIEIMRMFIMNLPDDIRVGTIDVGLIFGTSCDDEDDSEDVGEVIDDLLLLFIDKS